MKARGSTLWLPVATGVLALGLWQSVHGSLSDDWRFLFPSPRQVVTAWRENAAVLWNATLNTTVAAVLGFGTATLLSAACALVLALSRPLRAALYPYLMILQMMPVVIVAPILVLWLGPGWRSVATITALICFFPIVVNATQGLLSTDAALLDLFRMWRATRAQQLWRLRVPAALPYFFTGLRIAAVLAPIGALVGDYTAGSSAGDGGGLGFQAIIFSSQAKYAALFATAATTCVLGFLFAGVVSLAARYVLRPWHDAYATNRE